MLRRVLCPLWSVVVVAHPFCVSDGYCAGRHGACHFVPKASPLGQYRLPPTRCPIGSLHVLWGEFGSWEFWVPKDVPCEIEIVALVERVVR